MKKLMVVASALMVLGAVNVQADEGEKTYKAACFVCHDAGIAGSPKIDDKAAWAPRIAQGLSKLEEHAIKGFKGKTGVMPPKGGRVDLSDDVVKAAVKYMVDRVK